MDLRSLVEPLIANAIQARTGSEQQRRLQEIYDRVPMGALIERGNPAYADTELWRAGVDVGTPISKSRAKRLPKKQQDEYRALERLNERFQQAPALAPELRRLMAIRGMLTPNGITPEGAAFLQALSTGEYGL